MNTIKKTDWLKLARLLEQEHQLRLKIKALQEKALDPGFNLWVKHETKASEVSPAIQTSIQAAA